MLSFDTSFEVEVVLNLRAGDVWALVGGKRRAEVGWHFAEVRHFAIVRGASEFLLVTHGSARTNLACCSEARIDWRDDGGLRNFDASRRRCQA